MKNKKPKKKMEKKVDSLTKTPFLIIGLILGIFIIAIVGLVIFTYHLLYKSDYFFIKESQIEWLNEPLAEEPYQKLTLTGARQNIFKFNISSVAKEILTSHPEFKDILIIRNFPDRLSLKINPRVAVAQVGEQSFFLVDEEGIVLTETQDSIRENLPIITGIGWRLFRKIGQREDSLKMVRSLSLLKILNESNFLMDHILTKINASDYRNISFLIDDGLEVKIGHSNFKERLELLEETLGSMVENKDQIRYIDLRFDDVVVGTK